MAMPTFFDVVQNLNTTIVYGIAIFRIILMMLGFLLFTRAVLNLRVASLGEGAKLLPSQSKPTSGGAFMQMFIAGCLMLFAYNMTVAAVVGAMVNDSMTPIEMYSVASYVQNPNQEDFIAFIKQFAINVMYLIGFLSIYRGLSGWYYNSEGIFQMPMSKVFWHIFLGGLCFFPEWLVGVLSSAVGIDFIGFLNNIGK